MTIPAKDDPRVLALAEHQLGATPEWFAPDDRLDMSNQYARAVIGKCEAAGLIVLADNEATVDLIAETLARRGSDEFVAITGHGKAWSDIEPGIRARSIRSQMMYVRAVLAALRSSPPADRTPDHIRSLVAASPSITAGLVERVQHTVAQCHKALTDGSVTEESARAWLRTIVRSLMGTDEWGDDFDRTLNDWAESYRAAQFASSPPAVLPAAGGAPKHTHDGVRRDKAVDPHDNLGGQRRTIRGES